MKLLIVVLMLLSLELSAQTAVQNFSLQNAADESMVSLESFKRVAIIFTSNTCPFDRTYRDRINKLIKAYEGKIQFLLINSYPQPEEDITQMKYNLNSWNINVPYLADKDQAVMTQMGARKSPEVFLLNEKHVVVYNGSIDDNAQVANAVEENYLKDSIDELIAGQPIALPTTRPVGCSIRKK